MHLTFCVIGLSFLLSLYSEIYLFCAIGLLCILFHLMSVSGEHGLLLCIILYAKEREGLTARKGKGGADCMVQKRSHDAREYLDTEEARLQFIQQLVNIIQ